MYYIPDYDTKSMRFANFYYRRTHFSTHIPLGPLCYFVYMNIIGFIFVNFVNLQNYKVNPLLNDLWQIYTFRETVFLIIPCIFIFSSIVTLRG